MYKRQSQGSVQSADEDDWRTSPMFQGLIEIVPPFPNPVQTNQALQFEVEVTGVQSVNGLEVLVRLPDNSFRSLYRSFETLQPGLTTFQINPIEFALNGNPEGARGLNRVQLIIERMTTIDIKNVENNLEYMGTMRNFISFEFQETNRIFAYTKIQNIHLNKTMLHIVGIKNCNKIRDTKKWMAENEVEYEFIDIKKDPLTRDELKELEFKVGLDVLINKRGRKWRDLGLAKKDLSDEELFEQLLEHQVMIKRPVLIKGESVLVGYDEESFEAFLTDQEEPKKG